jgi:serine/threonine protein phosphatase PrpC
MSPLVLAECPELPRACDRLIELADDNGGKDNVTAVIANFD